MQIALRAMARNIVQRLPVAGKAVLACSRSFVTVRPLFKPTDAAIRQLSSITPVHQTIRTFAASAISKQSTALVEAINDELEHEKTQNTDREEIPDPPGDWVLADEPGECIVSLTKKYKDESILVEMNINDQADPANDFIEEGEDGEQEANIDLTVTFEATIEKGGKGLTFALESDGSYLDVQHVSFDSVSDIPDEDAYGGPGYSELDEKMQKAFTDFLEERGIDAELGEYLLQAADSKEQKEYLRWLKGIKGFLGSS